MPKELPATVAYRSDVFAGALTWKGANYLFEGELWKLFVWGNT
jgi:hypothetical protein